MKKLLKQRDEGEQIDLETIPVLRDFKIKQLKKILKDAVDMKYKISLSKGFMMFVECFIILNLMISLVLKANVFSLLYLIFIFRFATIQNKTSLLIKLNMYLTLSICVQYLLYLCNLNGHTSPKVFPTGYENYPKGKLQPDGAPILAIPVFFHVKILRENLLLDYLLGIGLEVN